MKLSVLLQDILAHPIDHEVTVDGLALDSRKVKQGDLFFACVGTQVDGKAYIDDAILRGARVVLAEGNAPSELRGTIPVIFIPDLGKKIGVIASRFYHHPSEKMQVVGITGTNGKTSCSHFIAAALTQNQLPCGVIGTLGNGLYGHIQESNLTTPDAVTLQKTLADFLSQHAKYVAMEVSSHSVDQGRMNGVEFEIGIFTNLTRDHLDYHGTMENYAAAKRKFFDSTATKTIVANADDAFGRKLIQDFHGIKPIYAYSLEKQKLEIDVPLISVENIRLDLDGIHARVNSPWGQGEISAHLIGKFNLSNILAAFTALSLLKIPFEKVLTLLSQLKSVPGRMQALGGKGKPLVVVDYAHTPDALEKVLQALRHHCQGKLICIFGCGGDRDRGKRPLMAAIAEKLADVVMMTDDNPRTENPAQIFEDILQGFQKPQTILQEHDRAKAIQKMIQQAEVGDCVLVAGKGAETYQIIGKEKFQFSDVDVVLTHF